MMKTLIEDAVCGTHSMRKAFAVVSAEILEKLSDQFMVGNNQLKQIYIFILQTFNFNLNVDCIQIGKRKYIHAAYT